MLLSLTPEQFEENNIIFSEKTKNTILANGDFYRIYYSDKNMSLNGIFINFKLKRVLIEPYFNKVKCTFDYNSNTVVINYLKNIEKKILGSLNNNNKNVYRIEEQLSNNFIKIFSELDQYKKKFDELNILLKISGIWHNKNEYGITFRFFFTHLL
jgi:hypothetical protein|tara:strand:+ start:547 stop:1011 length:465 start_codon:yes stop_codon:yes gene_type:complete